METKYIHYGHTNFYSDKFEKITNRPYFLSKPHGGFWASDVNAKFGWKDWCAQEHFRECVLENSVTFRLSDNANILHVRSQFDIARMERMKPEIYNRCCPDFEKMKRMGIDAIELHLSECWDLYFELYGWDCDSILVMNKDVIMIEGDGD